MLSTGKLCFVKTSIVSIYKSIETEQYDFETEKNK